MTSNPIRPLTRGYRLLRSMGLVGHEPGDGSPPAVDYTIDYATEQLYAIAHLCFHARGAEGVPESWIYNHQACHIGRREEDLIVLLFDTAITGEDLIAWGDTLARAITILETLEDKA